MILLATLVDVFEKNNNFMYYASGGLIPAQRRMK